jgi:hypothetical protein
MATGQRLIGVCRKDLVGIAARLLKRVAPLTGTVLLAAGALAALPERMQLAL